MSPSARSATDVTNKSLPIQVRASGGGQLQPTVHEWPMDHPITVPWGLLLLPSRRTAPAASIVTSGCVCDIVLEGKEWVSC